MTYNEIYAKLNSKIRIIKDIEIQDGRQLILDNGSKINCFNTGKHNVQGKNTEDTKKS